MRIKTGLHLIYLVRMLRWVPLVPFIAVACTAGTNPSAVFRVERHPISGGSELLTVFGRLPDSKTKSKFEDVPPS